MRLILLLTAALTAAAPAAQPAAPAGPLAPFDALVGRWAAAGDGFATTIAYRWLLPGTMLEAVNEVSRPDGTVITRYAGAYAWDAGREEVVFWTVSDAGEVHRGHAWWDDGVLYHEAEVSGGRLEVYASAARPAGGALEYFADYGRPDAGAYLLETTPLVYRPAPAAEP